MDVQALMELVGLTTLEQHQHARAKWVDAALECGLRGRDRGWTENVAVKATTSSKASTGRLPLKLTVPSAGLPPEQHGHESSALVLGHLPVERIARMGLGPFGIQLDAPQGPGACR